MKKFQSLPFKFGESEVLTVSVTTDSNSNSLQIDNSYTWHVIAKEETEITGTPTFTIQVSDDDSEWFEYNTEFSNLEFTEVPENQNLSFNYIRVVIKANGASAGTASFTIGLKGL